jgi:regulator of protease activity HflC (stomatin/prohibitin superfamily)
MALSHSDVVSQKEGAPESKSNTSDKSSPPFMMLILIILIAAFFSSSYLALSFLLPILLKANIPVISIGGILMILFFIMALPYLIIYLIVSKSAKVFFEKFYKPSKEIKPAELIFDRLNGYGSTVPIHEEKLPIKHEWLYWWGGPAKLVINDGFAAYLERGNRYSRVIGPGITFLEANETVKVIVTLRPIVRPGEIKAWTKDGLYVQLRMRMECQLGQAGGKVKKNEKLVYPFPGEDVKRAVEQTTVKSDPKNNSLAEANWVDRVWGTVQGNLTAYISGNTVDELFLAEWGLSQITSQETWKEILKDLNKKLGSLGARLLNLQIIDIVLPEEVKQQRTRNWEAEREGIAAITIGQTNAFEIREREKARAEAEQEIIANIAKKMEQMDKDRLEEMVLLSLSGILDQSLSDPFTRTLVTNETLDTLEKLRKML